MNREQMRRLFATILRQRPKSEIQSAHTERQIERDKQALREMKRIVRKMEQERDEWAKFNLGNGNLPQE